MRLSFIKYPDKVYCLSLTRAWASFFPHHVLLVALLGELFQQLLYFVSLLAPGILVASRKHQYSSVLRTNCCHEVGYFEQANASFSGGMKTMRLAEWVIFSFERSSDV